ncbi:flagellar hook-length control protein FliK [Ensifer soli]|uniref:flagellar hook-length control protein FliK n=1 Tax=Ciceribacter sp. sgz301302 TaxID=3342379 RepID=UPI0035BAAF16
MADPDGDGEWRATRAPRGDRTAVERREERGSSQGQRQNPQRRDQPDRAVAAAGPARGAEATQASATTPSAGTRLSAQVLTATPVGATPARQAQGQVQGQVQGRALGQASGPSPSAPIPAETRGVSAATSAAMFSWASRGTEAGEQGRAVSTASPGGGSAPILEPAPGKTAFPAGHPAADASAPADRSASALAAARPDTDARSGETDAVRADRRPDARLTKSAQIAARAAVQAAPAMPGDASVPARGAPAAQSVPAAVTKAGDARATAVPERSSAPRTPLPGLSGNAAATAEGVPGRTARTLEQPPAETTTRPVAQKTGAERAEPTPLRSSGSEAGAHARPAAGQGHAASETLPLSPRGVDAAAGSRDGARPSPTTGIGERKAATGLQTTRTEEVSTRRETAPGLRLPSGQGVAGALDAAAGSRDGARPSPMTGVGERKSVAIPQTGRADDPSARRETPPGLRLPSGQGFAGASDARLTSPRPAGAAAGSSTMARPVPATGTGETKDAVQGASQVPGPSAGVETSADRHSPSVKASGRTAGTDPVSSRTGAAQARSAAEALRSQRPGLDEPKIAAGQKADPSRGGDPTGPSAIRNTTEARTIGSSEVPPAATRPGTAADQPERKSRSGELKPAGTVSTAPGETMATARRVVGRLATERVETRTVLTRSAETKEAIAEQVDDRRTAKAGRQAIVAEARKVAATDSRTVATREVQRAVVQATVAGKAAEFRSVRQHEAVDRTETRTVVTRAAGTRAALADHAVQKTAATTERRAIIAESRLAAAVEARTAAVVQARQKTADSAALTASLSGERIGADAAAKTAHGPLPSATADGHAAPAARTRTTDSPAVSPAAPVAVQGATHRETLVVSGPVSSAQVVNHGAVLPPSEASPGAIAAGVEEDGPAGDAATGRSPAFDGASAAQVPADGSLAGAAAFVAAAASPASVAVRSERSPAAEMPQTRTSVATGRADAALLRAQPAMADASFQRLDGRMADASFADLPSGTPDAETASAMPAGDPSQSFARLDAATHPVPAAALRPVTERAAMPPSNAAREAGTPGLVTRLMEARQAGPARTAGPDLTAETRAALPSGAMPPLAMPTQQAVPAAAGETLFRFARADGRGQAMSVSLGADGTRPALSTEAPSANGRAETVTVLDARRFLGLTPVTNAEAVTSLLPTDPHWADAMRTPGTLTSEAQAAATGKVVNTLKIQMQPIELGLVTATLRLKGEELHVDLKVETGEAFRQLSDDQGEMVKALRAQGFSVDQVTIVYTPPDGAQQGDATFGQPQQGGQAMRERSGETGFNDGRDRNGNGNGSEQGPGGRGTRGEPQDELPHASGRTRAGDVYI